jgi:hypothetical protein
MRRRVKEAPGLSSSCWCQRIPAAAYRWCLLGQERYEAFFGPLCPHVAATVVDRAALRAHPWAPGEAQYVNSRQGSVTREHLG